MATFVSLTRLRLRHWRHLPLFGVHTTRSIAQVRRAEGFRGGALLPDRKLTFWTATLWDDRERMRAYMTDGAHRTAMPKLLDWCDEASVAHWDEPDAMLPSWEEADRRMRKEGRPSKVRRPSLDHAAMTFAIPRTTGGAPIRPVGRT